jgi:hypothetical protein
VFYKSLGLLTWKVIKFYVHRKVPTKRLLAGAVVASVAAIGVGAALQGRNED